MIDGLCNVERPKEFKVAKGTTFPAGCSRMFSKLSPKWMMIIGVALMLLGVILPWLMVLQLVQSTFFLVFLSHACSLQVSSSLFRLVCIVRVGRK